MSKSCMECHHILSPGSHETMKCSSLFEDLAANILGQGSSLRFRAHGNSMAPLIRNGDIVLVEPRKTEELHIGNIILYRRAAGRYVVHRLARKEGNNGSLMLTTKGDNMRQPDMPVSPEQVLGRVIRIESHGKELWIGGRAGDAINRLLLYISLGGYTRNTMRRTLTKLWWLAGRKHRRQALSVSTKADRLQDD